MTTEQRTSQTATAPLPWWQPGGPQAASTRTPPSAPPPPTTSPPTPTGGPAPMYGPPLPPTPAEPVGGPRGNWKRRIFAGTAAVVLCLGSGAAGAELALRGQADAPPAVANEAAVQGATSRQGEASVQGGTEPRQQLAKVAAAVQPSIVSLGVRGPGGSGSGSGVILGNDGTILTNNHVVDGAAQAGSIMVNFADGQQAEAQLVGRDPATDLAVVKAAGVSGLKPVTVGSTDDLHVGDAVLAVGSPLGLEGSVSAGIVSALHRPVNVGTTTLSDAIQTDAPINPGNSGGGLFDTSGRLVGINSAIATLGGVGQSGNIGVGFAIPIDAAKAVADQLIRGEKPTHALLGVQIANAASNGALLEAVTPGGPAQEAGLRAGDVVTKLEDRRVGDPTDLTAAVRSQRPGDEVEVTYVRDGDTRTTTATLASAS